MYDEELEPSGRHVVAHGARSVLEAAPEAIAGRTHQVDGDVARAARVHLALSLDLVERHHADPRERVGMTNGGGRDDAEHRAREREGEEAKLVLGAKRENEHGSDSGSDADGSGGGVEEDGVVEHGGRPARIGVHPADVASHHVDEDREADEDEAERGNEGRDERTATASCHDDERDEEREPESRPEERGVHGRCIDAVGGLVDGLLERVWEKAHVRASASSDVPALRDACEPAYAARVTRASVAICAAAYATERLPPRHRGHGCREPASGVLRHDCHGLVTRDCAARVR